MSYFVELNLPTYNADEEILNMYPDGVCVCCLAANVPYVNLSTCKHTEFLESCFKYKIGLPNTICYVCHKMLHKIELFKQQVQDSILILNKEVVNLQVRKMHDLKKTPVEIITVNITPEVISEVVLKYEPMQNDLDIKVESDGSDFDIETPLSEIKRQKETDNEGEEEIMLKRIKKEKSDPSPSMDEKYVGKLKRFLLTGDELEKEREDLRSEERYQKLPFKCEDCIVGFNREPYLRKHRQQRHGTENGKFVCDVCKSVFSTRISLNQHHRRHFIRYECEECGKKYIDERAIVSHYNDKHGEIGAIVHNKFKCQLDDCGFETHSYRSFMYHRSKHEAYPCKLCDKVYSKWIQLRSHIYGVHRQTQMSFPCDKCDKVYKQRCGLRIHMQSVHNTLDVTPYCAPCRMHFRTRNNLKQHLRQHSNHVTDADMKYMCDNCGARFVTKSSLKGHIKWVHLKISDFQCSKCLKMLKTARSLKNHIAFVHEKKQLPRDKICDYCGLSFTERRCLLAHIRTHTGERPYKCGQCAATFAHSAGLYNHKQFLHNPHRQRGRSKNTTAV